MPLRKVQGYRTLARGRIAQGSKRLEGFHACEMEKPPSRAVQTWSVLCVAVVAELRVYEYKNTNLSVGERKRKCVMKKGSDISQLLGRMGAEGRAKRIRRIGRIRRIRKNPLDDSVSYV